MPEIDIDVSPQLQAALDGLSCDALRIAPASPLKITLPMGELHALTDLSKGIPTDCSMTFNLMLQLQPFLASITCLVRILKLVKALIDVVGGLPLPKPQVLEDFAIAAEEVAECFFMIAAIPQFAKDLLCFVRAVLNCLLSQLRSVRDVLSGLQLRIEAAAGNADQLQTLRCAQENAQASVNSLTQAIDPIAAMLALADPIFKMAGVQSIAIETPGASPEDLEGLDALIDTLQAVVDAIDAMGFCDG